MVSSAGLLALAMHFWESDRKALVQWPGQISASRAASARSRCLLLLNRVVALVGPCGQICGHLYEEAAPVAKNLMRSFHLTPPPGWAQLFLRVGLRRPHLGSVVCFSLLILRAFSPLTVSLPTKRKTELTVS